MVDGAPGPEAAVVAMVATDPEMAVMLIRRAQRPGDPWSGQWALPGGRREPGDPDIESTARREVAEEIGVTVVDPLFRLPLRTAGRHRGAGVSVAPFLVRCVRRPCVRLAAEEVAGIHWLSMVALIDPRLRRSGSVPGGGGTAWPHVLVDGHPLWGFTLAVLDDVVRSVFPATDHPMMPSAPPSIGNPADRS